MTKTPEALARQHERTEKRRDQVLDAAEACFRREGFHAASVNRIAAEAGMSVGHLYRYFDSKDEIILALCERNFEEFISHAPLPPAGRKGDGQALVAAVLDEFAHLLDRVRAGFLMDVFAEAGRSEAIDAIVAVYEQRLRENARMLLEPLFPSERSEEIAERVEMMLLILQGTAVRTISNPAGDADRLKSAFRHLMTAIVQSPGS